MTSPPGAPVTVNCSVPVAPGRSGRPSPASRWASSQPWLRNSTSATATPRRSGAVGGWRPDAGEQVGLRRRGVDDAAGQDVVVVGVDRPLLLAGQPEPERRGRIDLGLV